MNQAQELRRRCCPVCLSEEGFEQVISCRDYTVSGETFQIVRCKTCGFLYTNPVPDEVSIGAYYMSEDYISHSNTRKGLVSKLYQRVREHTIAKKTKYIQEVSGKAAGDLLDLGCGTGEFLAAAKAAGWRAKGLEPSPQARDFAREHYALDVSPSDALFDLPEDSFDVVTLWHVLEHIHRLDDNLARLREILRPDGALIIAVPNASAWEAGVYGPYWAAWDVPRHLYHFTRDTMARLLRRHAFKIEDARLMPFDAYYVSLLSEQYKTGGRRLAAAALNGWRSNRAAKKNPDKASSLQYLARHA